MTIRPWFWGKRSALGLVAVGAVLGSGCATFKTLGESVTDPTSVVALNEPAPLTVVVQRADAASETAKQVDRLLTATPVDLQSDWTQQTELSAEYRSQREKDLAAHPYYQAPQGKGVRILPALAWRSRLSGITCDSAANSSLLAAIMATATTMATPTT